MVHDSGVFLRFFSVWIGLPRLRCLNWRCPWWYPQSKTAHGGTPSNFGHHLSTRNLPNPTHRVPLKIWNFQWLWSPCHETTATSRAKHLKSLLASTRVTWWTASEGPVAAPRRGYPHWLMFDLAHLRGLLIWSDYFFSALIIIMRNRLEMVGLMRTPCSLVVGLFYFGILMSWLRSQQQRLPMSTDH